MSRPGRPPRDFLKILTTGVGLLLVGAGLYFYTLSIPSSGVAMSGIGIGLLSLAGLLLAGIGALVAFVAGLFWLRAKARRGE